MLWPHLCALQLINLSLRRGYFGGHGRAAAPEGQGPRARPREPGSRLARAGVPGIYLSVCVPSSTRVGDRLRLMRPSAESARFRSQRSVRSTTRACLDARRGDITQVRDAHLQGAGHAGAAQGPALLAARQGPPRAPGGAPDQGQEARPARQADVSVVPEQELPDTLA